jgi:hypothetical protein
MNRHVIVKAWAALDLCLTAWDCHTANQCPLVGRSKLRRPHQMDHRNQYIYIQNLQCQRARQNRERNLEAPKIGGNYLLTAMGDSF